MIARADAEISPSKALDVFVAVESETDDYPAGSVRPGYALELLARLDAGVAKYLNDMHPVLMEACREIIRESKLRSYSPATQGSNNVGPIALRSGFHAQQPRSGNAARRIARICRSPLVANRRGIHGSRCVRQQGIPSSSQPAHGRCLPSAI